MNFYFVLKVLLKYVLPMKFNIFLFLIRLLLVIKLTTCYDAQKINNKKLFMLLKLLGNVVRVDQLVMFIFSPFSEQKSAIVEYS